LLTDRQADKWVKKILLSSSDVGSYCYVIDWKCQLPCFILLGHIRCFAIYNALDHVLWCCGYVCYCVVHCEWKSCMFVSTLSHPDHVS